jgi:predicted KAP-like P-loop ATPase
MWADMESKIDYLNYSEIAESIADIISSKELLPVSIGVYGDWGAGKSTILCLTEEALNKASANYINIRFDAWQYQGYDDAKASILEAITQQLMAEVEDNQSLFEKAKSLYSRVDKIRALGAVIDVGAASFGIPTGGIFTKAFSVFQEKFQAESLDASSVTEGDFQSIKDALNSSKEMLKDKKSPPKEISEFKKEYHDLLMAIDRPIVVYVDNLDRCTPENAIGTLEAIRLFLFLPNTAFIIAADEDMIRSAVREYHKGSTERHQTDYLDKLIQVPIKVPKPGILEIRAYLFMLWSTELKIGDDNLNNLRLSLEKSLRNGWKEKAITINELLATLALDDDAKTVLDDRFQVAERLATILATSSTINGNPRIVKRLLNVVRMRKKVADRRGMNLDESLITKLVIFERCAGKEATKDLYQLIDQSYGKPDVFGALESGDVDVELPKSWDSIKSFIIDWANLSPKLSGVDLRAAAYLSRETIPMGIVSNELSPKAKELVSVLLAVKSKVSPSAKTQICTIPREEYASVMESVISGLRAITDWDANPPGLYGAILLAEHESSTKQPLVAFLNGIHAKPWLKKIIKELQQ